MPKLVDFHDATLQTIDKQSWKGTRKATPAERHEYFNLGSRQKNVSPPPSDPPKGAGAKPQIQQAAKPKQSIWDRYKIEPPNVWPTLTGPKLKDCKFEQEFWQSPHDK